MTLPRRTLLAASVAVLLAACEPLPPPVPPPPAPPPAVPVTSPEGALRQVSFEHLPPLVDDGDRESLRLAVERSRRWLRARDPDRELTFGPRKVRAAELAAALDRFLGWLADDLPAEELASRLPEVFELWASVGAGGGKMLVTGYYEPVIEGSLRPTGEHRVPIYGLPPGRIFVDLGEFSDEWEGRRLVGRLRGNRLVPFPTRAELRGSDEFRGREIAWAADRVALFFLEIQGSGTLRLPDGRELRIGYAGSNGRPYRSIGKLLIDEGVISRERMSMQALRAYLAEHPEEVDRVLDYNASVVFFRKLDGPPVGSLGLPVTPGRSIAADQKLFPPAALAFLHTEVPALAEDGTTVSEGPLTRFVLVHDTGGAIRGTDRADFFWGRGEEAAYRAGSMKHPGRLFFLVPRSDYSFPQ